MFLDYFALFMLFFVGVVLFYTIIVVHDIPYEIAVKRNHPHQDAIHIAGWVSLFTLHILWPFLWIWATLWREDRGWGFAQIKDEHEVAIHLHGGVTRPPKPVDAQAQRLFDLVKECGAQLGQDIGWQSTGGVCDGNNIAACGVPVVDTMGVRGGAIHSPQEFLMVSSLAERAALSALVIGRIAAGDMN